jgi:hypothetical protein
VRAATLPLADHVIALSDEVRHAPEIQVRERRAKFGGELAHVIAAAAGCVHRVLETDIRGGKLVDDTGVPRVSP